jgi:putative DNA primase/helicase
MPQSGDRMAKNSRHRHRTKGNPPTRVSVALLYASHGVPVVPLHGLKKKRCTCGDENCERPGGHPRADLDFADGTCDRDEITRWWKKWPNARIGIVLGWPSKLMALVTDGAEARSALRAIAATHGKVPHTVTIDDHDSRLRLFRVAGTMPRNMAIGKGVRILGDADLICAPSNLNGPTGKRRFASGRALADVEIAVAPQWLREICAKGDSDQGASVSQQRLEQSKSSPPIDRDSDPRLIVTRAADVVRRDIEWLWPGRIALGKLSVIAGHPDLGKSQLATFLAATVSTGREWPNHEGSAPLGTVIMLMAEDDAADTVIPRLEAANAHLSRVHFIDISKRPFDLLSDIQTLEQEIRRFGDVRLIIIDPITAFLKSTGFQRAAATHLQRLSANLGAAVIAVSHLAKSARTNALAQVTGSLGLVAVARAVFIIAEEKGTDRRLFLTAKNNLTTRMTTALAYRIEKKAMSTGITSSAVVWDSAPVVVTADEALASVSGTRKPQPALTDAEDFLRVLLGAGPVPAKDVRAEASEAGVSPASLRRAAGTLGVKSRRIGGVASRGRWVWELPDGSGTGDGKTRALTDTRLSTE